jgi:hypothetical protein
MCPVIVRMPFILNNFFDLKTGTITGHALPRGDESESH